MSDFCGSVSARVAKYTNYEVAFDYWDDEPDVVVSDVLFEQPRSFRYVPVPLRETSRSTIAVPFRRRLDLPWHVMIALRQRAICPKLLRQISVFRLAAAANIYSRGPVPSNNTEGNMPMSWTTPTLVEVCIGLEINGYLPPEF